MPDSELKNMKQRLDQLEDENGRLRAKLERMELDNRSPGLDRTIHGLQALVIQTDTHGNVSYINSAAENAFDLKRQQVIGRPLSTIDNLKLGRGYLQLLLQQASESGHDVSADRHYPDPATGEMRYVKLTAASTPMGGQVLIEDQSKFKRLESTFRRYVAPNVIERMLTSGADFFKPEKYELTVLFADLRGFTRLCTVHTPEEVKHIIDRFLGVMMRVIIDADATVDKVVGDEIMALFGAPIRTPDHAVQAVNAALRMQEQHINVVEEWRAAGVVNPPQMGIGINTGEMIVGNIGSELRMDYTVLGHHVNLASRLCDAAKGGDILIAPRTFELARAELQKTPEAIPYTVKFRKSLPLSAKGIDRPIEPISVARIH
jgi:class 3 adenylate cyclase